MDDGAPAASPGDGVTDGVTCEWVRLWEPQQQQPTRRQDLMLRFRASALYSFNPKGLVIHLCAPIHPRTQGCRLPIEMFYPPAEWPPEPIIDAFSKLGVTSRKMDFRLVRRVMTHDVDSG